MSDAPAPYTERTLLKTEFRKLGTLTDRVEIDAFWAAVLERVGAVGSNFFWPNSNEPDFYTFD